MAEGNITRDFIGVIHEITGTTDSRGLLNIASVLGQDIPIAPVFGGYIFIFFNGSSQFYFPYVKVTDYEGTPITEQTVTFQVYCVKR